MAAPEATHAGPTLPGYRTGPLLRRGADRLIYRGWRESSGRAVAIETLAADYPGQREAAEIRRDGRIARTLGDIDGILRVDTILPHGSGNVALITEPVVDTLADRLEESGDGLPLAEVLDLGIRLAELLDAIHARHVVHKALSPARLRIDREDGSLRLSGFGIASELDRERQTATQAGIEAPLPYLSPEQTGRMNRELDYRSDYYSLGITLFELLTGRLPFEAEGVLEWVHQHISRPPPSPAAIDPAIPPPVAAIVLKLLAKDPEDRYQSGRGLARDLAHCAEAVAAGREPEPFVPGEADRATHFLLPQALYGRERERTELTDLFESAAAGAAEVCLVHGHSGVGKSALVNELDRSLVRERGFFARGKFDQFHQGSYGALADALRDLVQQLLAEPADRLDRWREHLARALGPNGRLVLELVPELELIVGPQPPVADLPPAEARNRRRIVLAAFLRVFAGSGHPLVLFLDDLQWSDGPTRDLFLQLATARDMDHLLMIGAWRSNEVPPGHPLAITVESLKAARPVHDLPVEPLDRHAIRELVADTLDSDTERVRPLADLLHDKAQGNPFFTNELLRTLHEEGVIRREDDGWHWDLDAAVWAGLSSDIVAFMAENLRKLPGETQRVLQLAACIGNRFDLDTLAVIFNRSAEATADALRPALRQHSIVPLNADYRLVGGAQTGAVPEAGNWNPSYRFVHDRVQQAAYTLSQARRMEAVHLSIGRLMRDHAGSEPEGERLMEIVRHLDAGHSLIDDPDERLELARLNLRAGSHARSTSAYEMARELLETGFELLPEPAWETEPQLAFALGREIQQCAYLTGRQDEADRWAEALQRHARDDLERVELLATRTRQYATLGRMDDSIRTAIEGLIRLGLDVDPDPDAAAVAAERRRIARNLGDRRIAELVDAAPVENRGTLLAMRLLMEVFPAAFLSGSGNLFPYLVEKAVNLSLEHGNSPESAFSFAAYGMLLCGELDDPATGLEYGRLGLAINERFDDLALRARVIYVYAMFVHHWSHHWSTLTPWFRRGVEAGYQSGDLLYLAYSAQDCVIWDPTLELPEATRRHEENLEIVRECNYQDSLDSATLFRQMQYAFQGRTDGPLSLSDATFDERECLDGMRERGFMTGVANYRIYKAEVAFLHDDPDAALEQLADRRRLIRSAMSLPQLVRFHVLDFLARVTSDPARAKTGEWRALLEEDLGRMRRWADNCEANFRHLQYLMEAELFFIDDRPVEAMERMDAAIEMASRQRFLRDEAMACERAARQLVLHGHDRAAEGYLRAAHRLFSRWGARRKIDLLEDRHPFLREIGGRDGTDIVDGQDLDLASIMKASRAIAGEMQTDRLLRTTLDILLENAGGQWAALVRQQSDGLTVDAAGGDVPDAPSHLPASARILDRERRPLPLPVTLLGHVLGAGKTVVLDDAGRLGEFTRDPCILALKPRSVLCVPVRLERFSGALYMENNLASGAFTAARAEVVRLLAAQAAVSLENARLYEQVQEYSRTLEARVAERTERLEQLNRQLQELAERDGLTGLANRRRGDAYLAETWNRLCREGRPLSLIMFDVDHFKAYNDNYGHPMGDQCLTTIADAIRETLKRPADLAVRYGGEEFMIILPDTDAGGAGVIGERLRAAVEALGLPHAHSSTAPVVTISVGTASRLPGHDTTPQALLDQADEALYRAKNGGRNRVES
ncbi:MAG: diguanylate cyclase domain-containing protein [Guyparkeria sp.]